MPCPELPDLGRDIPEQDSAGPCMLDLNNDDFGFSFLGNNSLATSLTHTDLTCQNLGSTGLIGEFLAQAHDATKEAAWLPVMGTRSCSRGVLHKSCRGCQVDGLFGFSTDIGPYYFGCPRTERIKVLTICQVCYARMCCRACSGRAPRHDSPDHCVGFPQLVFL